VVQCGTQAAAQSGGGRRTTMVISEPMKTDSVRTLVACTRGPTNAPWTNRDRRTLMRHVCSSRELNIGTGTRLL
jgi:hypothetical protein